MPERLIPGTRVETVKPEKESTDWQPSARLLRRWGAVGRIMEHSDSHGLVYHVEHEDDKTSAWYEPRELVTCSKNVDYTPAERAEMLGRMKAVSDMYYRHVTATGCHAMIEFTGLMNEFIKACEAAHLKGQQFPFANTHNEVVLPFEPHNLVYLAEKLDCIYGPSLRTSEENRDAFVAALFGGSFKLVPAKPPVLGDLSEYLDD